MHYYFNLDKGKRLTILISHGFRIPEKKSLSGLTVENLSEKRGTP